MPKGNRKLKSPKREPVSLWFQADEPVSLVREQLLIANQSLEILHLPISEFFTESNLVGIDLPRLTELTLPDLNCLDNTFGWQWLHRLHSLNKLLADTTMASDAIIGGLAHAPWLEQLIQLDLKFLGLEKTSNWNSIWADKTLQLQLLSLYYLEPDHASGVLEASIPLLAYLLIGSNIGSGFLDQLAETDLPRLEDVDLRQAVVSVEDLSRFVSSDRTLLPKLRRIGKNYASDRVEQYSDWNGAAVGTGYEMMTDREFENHFLKGTGLKSLPSNFDLEIRYSGYGSGPLRMLKRLR